MKSQAEVATPHEFFLRPALEEDKFPGERPIELSAELRTRVQAQEQAGRLVFIGESRDSVPSSMPTETKAASPAIEHVDSSSPAQEVQSDQIQVSVNSHLLGSLRE